MQRITWCESPVKDNEYNDLKNTRQRKVLDKVLQLERKATSGAVAGYPTSQLFNIIQADAIVSISHVNTNRDVISALHVQFTHFWLSSVSFLITWPSVNRLRLMLQPSLKRAPRISGQMDYCKLSTHSSNIMPALVCISCCSLTFSSCLTCSLRSS